MGYGRRIRPANLRSLIFSTPGTAGRDFGSVMMKIIGISYAVIICIMTGKAIMNFIRIKNRFNLILALGSVLFLISDIMLLMAYFSKIDFPFSNFCLALYYPGQCLIANGLAHIKTAITEKIRVA